MGITPSYSCRWTFINAANAANAAAAETVCLHATMAAFRTAASHFGRVVVFQIHGTTKRS